MDGQVGATDDAQIDRRSIKCEKASLTGVEALFMIDPNLIYSL